MRVDVFDFDLPGDRIALRPHSPRDEARLLVVNADKPVDHHVLDLPDLLDPGDVLVFNDTKVIPARLTAKRGQAKIEVTLHKCLGGPRWAAFARPARKCRPDDVLDFAGMRATVLERREGGEILLEFDRTDTKLLAHLEDAGTMPLPPYIAGKRPADDRDRLDYQTVFASKSGAVAAPTAGLHFTDRLLNALERRGVIRVPVTLHVGAGTFLPVKAEKTEDHIMHAEWGEISPDTAATLNRARDTGRRIVAVGTTALRLLESAADQSGRINPFTGETDIFITPGYRFRVVDLLVTNFHLPRSTLFMLVCAFSGTERMKAAYRHAIDRGYRFYSYGDACLLYPEVVSP